MPADQFESFVNTFGQSFSAPNWFVLYFTVENFVKVVTVHLLFFCPSFVASHLQLSHETNDDLAFCRGPCNVVILFKFTLLNIVHLLHRIVHWFAFGISINFGKMFLNLNFLSFSSAGTDGHQLQIFFFRLVSLVSRYTLVACSSRIVFRVNITSMCIPDVFPLSRHVNRLPRCETRSVYFIASSFNLDIKLLTFGLNKFSFRSQTTIWKHFHEWFMKVDTNTIACVLKFAY